MGTMTFVQGLAEEQPSMRQRFCVQITGITGMNRTSW